MLKSEETKYYWRRIPHIQPKDASIFLTFRVAESMPLSYIRRLEEYKSQLDKVSRDRSDFQNYRQKKIFAFYDEMLCETKLQNRCLIRPEIAQIIVKTLHELNNQYYQLFCYTIMPNHVHILIRILNRENGEPHEMAFVLKKIKGTSAREINVILDRRGRFWQREYYDYCARSEKEVVNISHYILMNPVKAGLVKEPGDWQWSWVADIS